MTRDDMIARERETAANYRREAKRRRPKNPVLADLLEGWAAASEGRLETLRCGPLFRKGE